METVNVLLLSDHIDKLSGVGRMSREIVYNSTGINWIQVGGAYLNGEVEKREINSESTITIYPRKDYGDIELVYALIKEHSIDIILHFTDPRFWGWLYQNEFSLRNIHSVKIAYYSIWDELPIPRFNEFVYNSCDILIAINKIAKKVHDELAPSEKIKKYYVPHGVDPNKFFPISGDQTYELEDIRREFYEKHKCRYVFFWNNVNMKRKNPLKLMEAFAQFYRKNKNGKQSCLLMKTDPFDSNSANLIRVKRDLYDDVNIVFSPDKLTDEQLNLIYNIADATISVSSNEGFGLSVLESQMAGTRAIVLKTGGLKDQIVEPYTIVIPTHLSLTGSPSANYIYEASFTVRDFCNALDLALSRPQTRSNRHNLRKEIIKRGMTSNVMSTRISEILRENKVKSNLIVNTYTTSII